MASEWYFQLMGSEVGPISSAALRLQVQNGWITPDTFVREANSTRWVTADNIKGLFEASVGPEVPQSQEKKVSQPVLDSNQSKVSPLKQSKPHKVPFRLAALGGAFIFVVILVVVFSIRKTNRTIENAKTESAVEVFVAKSSLAERRAKPDKASERHPNGSLSSEYSYYQVDSNNRIRHGSDIAWYEDGKVKMQGEWLDGQRVGSWVAWHKNGQKLVEGSYLQGQAVGTWSYWDQKGNPAGSRQDGIKVGTWKEWDREGKTYAIGEYLIGLKQGSWTLYGAIVDHSIAHSFPSISLTYKDDLWHGPMTVYNATGDPEIHYFFEDGKEVLDKRAMYVPAKDRFGFDDRRRVEASDKIYGILLKSRKGPLPSDLDLIPAEAGPFEPPNVVYQPYNDYYSSGKLRAQGRFKLAPDGKRMFDGEFTKWYADGIKESIITYRQGFKHGIHTEWYKDGVKKREGFYHENKGHGVWTFWYASGSLASLVAITLAAATLGVTYTRSRHVPSPEGSAPHAD